MTTVPTCTFQYRVAGCLSVADPAFTIRFGEAPELHYCSSCGPAAMERAELLRRLLDAGYAPELERALDVVVRQN